ncbi:hypothetical protein ACFQAV_12440 [Companilactobacillus huachuanensis]|uniref:Chromosome partitioning protein ParA n=1 Tax=Companilactobacillus huachuanensis TaxID=2559914 RepID=A0ABW1RQB4_9LACO|nr:hypothetical protein [Companilactobacillus huachuanensis]
MNKETLRPVSFHLRNFNNYTMLNMPASQNGNLTLIGENAAGKTTLANCFFPMLIDGSIATPSFNPAKGTDRLDKTTTRNSANDTRNFEGMLLGWGSGAMKVRTGYSYMLMESEKRQVIVGIGAHRAVGESRKPTWWFVAINEDLSNELSIQTTDEVGRSLEKDEFIDRNQDLAGIFKIFSQVNEFQNYVSEKIYGFTNPKSLNQLAITYRLLASPILTAGNARLTPILEAMKNAQEGIDTQVIDFVANTQRDVNRKKAILERLTRAEKRLIRLKKEIFWRNLNRLKELTLDPYGDNHDKLTKQSNMKEHDQHKLDDYVRQLGILQPMLQQSEELVQDLQKKMAEQKTIEELRHGKQDQVKSIMQRLAVYESLKKQYDRQQAELETSQKRMDQLKARENEFIQQVIPLQNRITDLTDLTQLQQATQGNDLDKLVVGLDHYLRRIKNLKVKYDGIQQNQKHLSEDIEIVTEIRENMDGKIDLRTNGPVVGRIRPGLHQDNLEVHNAGANKMSLRHAALEQERKDLLATNPDLQRFLNTEALFKELKEISEQLKQFNKDLNNIKSEIDKQDYQFNVIKKGLDESVNRLELEYKNFDIDEQNKEIEDLRIEIDALVIDPKLGNKIVNAKDAQAKYQQSERELNNKKTATQTRIEGLVQRITELENILTKLADQTEADLKILEPYMIDGIELEKITETMRFVDSKRSDIRSHSFNDLSSKISYIIRHDNENGIDPYALDSIFEDRGHTDIASSMRQQRSINHGDLQIVPFDIKHAQKLIVDDKEAVEKSLEQLNSGNEAAQMTYIEAAAHQISDQYDLIDGYNEVLAHGVQKSQGIQLKV